MPISKYKMIRSVITLLPVGTYLTITEGIIMMKAVIFGQSFINQRTIIFVIFCRLNP